MKRITSGLPTARPELLGGDIYCDMIDPPCIFAERWETARIPFFKTFDTG